MIGTCRLLLVGTLVVFVLSQAAARAPAPKPAVVEEKKTPKTVKVAFANAPLLEVFHWLEEQTGKRIMSCTPNRTFTLVGPPGKEYTIAEVIAAINEALAQQPDQFILIEREKHFSLLLRKEVVGGR